ncbi:isopentenyl-diphosphate Delta-isomerase [Chitinophagaceae bacterium MMS25-I14]
MNKEYVQLVNDQNVETGIMEKMEAHYQGVLHRAVSVLVFNGDGKLLLQQRAPGKYHSGGLWSNTCCTTHPRPGETTHVAATRRLKEELNISCELFPRFSFIYRVPLGNGLIEYEFDEVFCGYSDSVPTPDPEEVLSWKYLFLDEIDQWLKRAPDNFTQWFPLLYQRIGLFP